MANILDSLMPKILAKALIVLRSQTVMPILVNRDIANIGAQKGNTIDVPIPTALEANDVVPSHVPPANTDETIKTVPVTLNNWKEVPFHLTDLEMSQIDANGIYLPMQLQSAVEALARSVNSSIFAEYKSIYGFYGTPGTTPLASSDSDIIEVRKIMAKQNVPQMNRNFVLDPNAEAKALALPSFNRVNEAGKSSVKIEGQLGRFYGFDFYEDNDVPLHTAGTGAGYQTSAAALAGATTVGVDTGTGTIVLGDIVSFAGDTQTYAVTSALAGGAIGIFPALKTNIADNAAVTIRGSHTVNLAFHRDAFAFAMRPLEQSLADVELGNKMVSMQDPKTGLVMRLEVSRQHKQTRWSLDMLWGTKLVRPELGVRLAG